jgi:hypothetical protein
MLSRLSPAKVKHAKVGLHADGGGLSAVLLAAIQARLWTLATGAEQVARESSQASGDTLVD